MAWNNKKQLSYQNKNKKKNNSSNFKKDEKTIEQKPQNKNIAKSNNTNKSTSIKQGNIPSKATTSTTKTISYNDKKANNNTNKRQEVEKVKTHVDKNLKNKTIADLRTVTLQNKNDKNSEYEVERTKLNKQKEQANKKYGVDYRANFDDFKKQGSKTLTRETKNEDNLHRLKPQNQESVNKVKEETESQQEKTEKAYNEKLYADYLNNAVRANTDNVTNVDKTLGVVKRATTDMFSPLLDNEKYTDTQGNKKALPTYDSMRNEKVNESYNTKVGRAVADVAYNGTKIGETALLNMIPGANIPLINAGLGSALYYADTAENNYKQNLNNGYSTGQNILNTALKTGSSLAKERLLGGVSKALTGKTSGLQNTLANQLNRVVNNPNVANTLAGGASEFADEFSDEYIENLIDLATLDKSTNPKDYLNLLTNGKNFQNALYSGLIGAGTGVLGGTLSSLNKNSEANTIKRNVDTLNLVKNELQNGMENEKNSVKRATYREAISDIDNYLNAPFGNEANQPTNINTENTNQGVGITQKEYNRVVKIAEQQNLSDEQAETFIKNIREMKENNPNVELNNKQLKTLIPQGNINQQNSNSILQQNNVDNNSKLVESDQFNNINTNNNQQKQNQLENNNVNNNQQINPNLAEAKSDEKLTIKDAKDGDTIKLNNNRKVKKDGNVYTLEQDNNNNSSNNKSSDARALRDEAQNLANSVLTDGKGNKISNFMANLTEKSKFLPEDFRDEEARKSYFNYSPEANEETMNRALDKFATEGEQKVITDFFTKEDGFTNDDVVTGWILLKRYTDIGNYDGASEVAHKMTNMATTSGRAVQMYNLMERLTPEGMVRFADKELQRAENEWVKGKSKKQLQQNEGKFQLSGDETKFIIDNMNKVKKIMDGDYDIDDLKLSGDDRATKSYNKWIDKNFKKGDEIANRSKDVLLAQIQSMLSNKLPREKGQSLQNWMRISMLFNAKTQVRNIGGNAAAAGINQLADIPSSLVDRVVSKWSDNRTLGVNPQAKKQLKGFKDASIYALQDARLGIDTKDVDVNRFDVSHNGKAFDDEHTGVLKPLNVVSKAGNGLDTMLDLAMSGGDRIFYEPAFQRSLANQMVLNNVDTPTQEMIDLAKTEALQRTWNDDNNYTKAVLSIRNLLNKFGKSKFGYGLGDVLIPFAKTPANLTKAIVEYSPVGLAKSVVDIKGIKDSIDTGQLTLQQQHDFSQNMGKGLVGTVLYGVGVALAKSGITSGANDDDKDTANFEKNSLGIQPYSIKIGNKSFAYDWLQPFGSSLAITADAVKSLSEDDDSKTTMEKIINLIDKSSNVAMQQLTEQSFMQSISEALSNNEGLWTGIKQQVLNLPARAVPTFMQQMAQMFDSTKRQTYVKDNPLKSAFNSALVKIPGLSKKLPAQTNTMGNELKYYGGKKSNDVKGNLDYAFKTFLSPANYNEGKLTKAGQEIYNVYQATGDSSIMPRQSEYKTKLDNGENKNFTSEERQKIQKKSGKIVEEQIDNLTDNSEYQNLSEEEKAEVIKKIVSYANAKAVADTIDGKSISSTYRKADSANTYGYSIADFYLDKVSTPKTESTPTDYNSAYQEMADVGIDAKTYERFRNGITQVYGTKNAKGNTIRGSARANKIKWINENFPELTAEQKQALYDDYNAKQGNTSFYSYKRRDN